MATKGRDGDSMLVHMTPGEVAGLHALAVEHGGGLTINPDTGLPEANFLKKLLPTIIGAGLTYFSGGTINPKMAAAIVGGFETVRTGDIGRGLSAGLGAYGGAGMTAGLAGAGADAMTTAGVGDYAKILTERGLQEGTPAFGEAASELALQSQKEALAAPFADRLSTGFNTVTKNPDLAGTFLKGNAKNLMYAAGPAIMAGENVENKLPRTLTKPGMIRPFSFDPYSGTYTALEPYEATPTRAADGGLMSMDDGGYNPGDLAFAERSEPVVRMAEGGIAALAKGGFTDAQVASYIQNNQLSGQALQNAADVFGLSTDQLGRAQSLIANKDASIQAASDAYNTAVAGRPDLVAQNLAYYNPATQTGSGWEDVVTNRFIQDQPGATFAQINTAKEGSGITNEDLTRSFDRYGYSGALYNVATSPDWKNDLGLTGFAGLSSNINRWVDNANKLNMTPAEKRSLAYSAMEQNDMNMKDIVRATGKTIEELFPDTKTKIVTTGTTDTTGTTGTTGSTQGGVNDITNVDASRLFPGVSGSSGAGQIGGGTVVNPNGTITTSPRIPGIPVGGFTGMENLRDVYTQRGGSLGYTPYVPIDPADFEARYNRTKGGSRQALDYLMGKGDYPVTPYTPTGEIQKPYWESVGLMPTDITTKKYLFQNGRYVENPDYIPPVYKDGVRSAGLTTNEVIKGIEPFKGAGDDLAMFDWMTENNVTEQQLATALGIPRLEVRARIAAARKQRKAINDRDAAAKAAAASGSEGAADGGVMRMAAGGLGALARGGSASQYNLGDYSDGGRLLRGPGDGVSDSIPASIGNKRPARLADGEFVVPARIVSELGNGSTEAGARKLYAMMDRVQKARRKTTGKRRVATNTRADKYLPA
jgi:hypothetical protein